MHKIRCAAGERKPLNYLRDVCPIGNQLLGISKIITADSLHSSLIGSWKNSDRSFGVLAGVAGVNNRVVTRGYETAGWTNANLTYDQCGAAAGTHYQGCRHPIAVVIAAVGR